MAKKDVDVLFINPGSRKAIYQSLGDDICAVEPPSLSGLFAEYIKKKGFVVDIVDAMAHGYNGEDVAQLVSSSFNPTLVVLVVYGYQPSASTQNMDSATELCQALKDSNPSIPILMTGTHPSALPVKTLQETAVDFVCNSEGPVTILETLKVVKARSTDVSNVPGLCHHVGNEVVNNPPPPLIQNLDEEMPGVAWELLPMDMYRAHNWHCFDHIDARAPYASIHTSFGCPYRCTFCCINAPFGKSSYRLWSPDTVVKEIDILVNKYGIRNIKFIDEMFILNPQHVLGICDRLIERNYDLNIWAYARVDTVQDKFLEKLRKAGFRWLCLGIESGSKHVRDGVTKGRFSQEDIQDTVRRIKDAGIYLIGNYIFGLPDDTFESMEETLAMAMELNCEFSNFYSAMAYPGSKLYTMAIKEGWELPSSWIGFSQHGHETFPMKTETLSSKEVLLFRDAAFNIFYENENYYDMLRVKFGQGVVDEVKRIMQKRLPRKLFSEDERVTMEKTLRTKFLSVV
ncbi:radical SAM protein [Simkania negevensis]|uniref:Radical SAM protein n=1 Tax=Simkania negevensis TaxID=83561 RepID=A0ABS3ASZ4_9BACT|nr:radical SAM protein [Simkania negevensis]